MEEAKREREKDRKKFNIRKKVMISGNESEMLKIYYVSRKEIKNCCKTYGNHSTFSTISNQFAFLGLSVSKSITMVFVYGYTQINEYES